MAGFKILKDINDSPAKKLPISSLAVTIGDLLELAVGATTWTAVTASSEYFTRKAIAMETVTSSATEVLCQEVNGTETVEVDCVAGTANADDNGDRMIATDKDSINNTGTDDASENVVFIQDGVGSTTSKIIGRIIVGNGVNPDAT